MFECFHNPLTSDIDYGIFNVRSDVSACDCTRGCTDTCTRVCTENWLWEKNLLPHRGIEPAACRSDALPTELHSHPFLYVTNLKIPKQRSRRLKNRFGSTQATSHVNVSRHNLITAISHPANRVGYIRTKARYASKTLSPLFTNTKLVYHFTGSPECNQRCGCYIPHSLSLKTLPERPGHRSRHPTGDYDTRPPQDQYTVQTSHRGL